MQRFPAVLSSSKQQFQEKRKAAKRYRLSHHICITCNRVLSSQTKQPSQALLIQTEHTLNKDCSRALLYSTHAISKGLFAWLDFVWVKALIFVLILIRKAELGGTEKEIKKFLHP